MWLDPQSKLNGEHAGHAHRELSWRFCHIPPWASWPCVVTSEHPYVYWVLLMAFKVILKLFPKSNKIWHTFCQAKCWIKLLVDRSLSFEPLPGILVLSHQPQELGDGQLSVSSLHLHRKQGPHGLPIFALVLVLKCTSLEGKWDLTHFQCWIQEGVLRRKRSPRTDLRVVVHSTLCFAHWRCGPPYRLAMSLTPFED